MSLIMWWPSPEAIHDLTITETEEGFALDAPSDTECGEWLIYWNQSEDHRNFFNQEFEKAILDVATQLSEISK